MAICSACCKVRRLLVECSCARALAFIGRNKQQCDEIQIAVTLVCLRQASGRACLTAPVDQKVSCGHDENRENNRGKQAADNGASERRIGFAAGFQLERHGEQTHHGGERRHQNRTEADAARMDDGFTKVAPLRTKHVGEIDDQDAVGDDHALEA